MSNASGEIGGCIGVIVGHTRRLEDLAELEVIAALTTIQCGNGGVVIDEEAIITAETIDPQASVDVLIIIDAFNGGAVVGEQSYEGWQ